VYYELITVTSKHNTRLLQSVMPEENTCMN